MSGQKLVLKGEQKVRDGIPDVKLKDCATEKAR
jgi:hypothetical protein